MCYINEHKWIKYSYYNSGCSQEFVVKIFYFCYTLRYKFGAPKHCFDNINYFNKEARGTSKIRINDIFRLNVNVTLKYYNVNFFIPRKHIETIEPNSIQGQNNIPVLFRDLWSTCIY